MRLTRATPDCEAEIRDLDAVHFPDTPFPSDSAFWTIDGDPELGYCGAEIRIDASAPSGTTVHLTRAWVCPDLRGRGWQTRMVRVRLAWARTLGAQRAETYTACDNVPSMRTLARAGFVPVRAIPYRRPGPAQDLDGAWLTWDRALV